MSRTRFDNAMIVVQEDMYSGAAVCSAHGLITTHG